MNIKNIISLKEVSQDLKIAKEFYEKQSFGLGTYFLDSILSDIESLWLYGGIHEKLLACIDYFQKDFLMEYIKIYKQIRLLL